MSSLNYKSSKVVALLLVVVMIISMIPISLFTAFAAPTTEFFTVSVTDSVTNSPIVGAEVRLTTPDESWTIATENIITDENGLAKFDTAIISNALSEATIDTSALLCVSVSKLGYEDYSNSEAISVDNLTIGRSVKLVAREQITLTGLVTDEKGQAYAGAKVQMTGTLSDETTTDANGNYSFQVYKNFGDYTITASATESKYSPVTTTVSKPTENYTCTTLKFEVKQFTVSTNASGNGTITAADTVAYGEDKEVTATADNFYRIQKFEVDGTDIPDAVGHPNYTYTIENITSAKTVNVTFVRYSYKINFTVSENGEVKYNDGSDKIVAGGSVSVDKEVAIENGTITVNATPSTNYRVAKVVVDETTQNFNENDKTYSEVFEINKDHTFAVEFARNFTITTKNGSNGTSSVETSNGSAVVTITPDTGYNIEKVTINEVETTDYAINDKGSFTLKISNITEDTMVNVEYSETPTIDLNAIAFSDAKKTVEEDNVITYIYAPKVTATVTNNDQNKKYIGINGVRTTNDSFEFTESTLIERIEVYNAETKKWEKVNCKNIQIIIDTKAPVVEPANANIGWKTADNVTISVSVTDETPDKPSSGLSYIVWSKDATLTEDAVLNATENKVVLDTDGTYSFTSVDGEQNATYYIYAVDNAGNVSKPATVKVKIDKTTPTITGFTFEEKQNGGQKFLSILTFGIISSKDIYVTVTASDEGDYISGVQSITLKYGKDGKDVLNVDKYNTATFKLTTKNFKNGVEISAQATDKAGNSSGDTKPSDITKGMSNTIIIDSTTVPKITITPAEPNYTEKTGTTTGDKLWYNDNLNLTIVAKDENTGIKKVSVKLNGEDITTDIEKNSIDADFSEKLTKEKTFVINTSQNALVGKNVIEVVVTNNAGIESTATQDVYIDKNNPNISNFEITPVGNTPVEKTINFLTFGIFFNEKVKVTVTASDGELSCGVKSITLFAGEEQFGEPLSVDENNKATFVIPAEDITDNHMHFNKVISAKAKDFVGNEPETSISPTTVNSNIENSGLMIETIKPTISLYCAEAAQNKNSATADENDWYNEDVEFTVDVADADAGIRNVNISINNTPLVNEDLYTKEKVLSMQYKVTTNDTDVVRAADGSYTIKVVVVDNAGNVSETQKTVYKDSDMPYIIGFDFDAVEFIEGSETASTVEVTDYGFYFKADTKVTVTAKDNAPSSGIKSITYYTVDKDAGESKKETVEVNKDGQIEFVIKAQFKGQVYAKATDNVDNVADKFMNPNSAIVEDESKHKEENHILFAKDNTEFRASDNTELYAKDVPVKLTVIDTYSGIRSIEWSVNAPYDTDNDQSGKITVNNDKSFATDSDDGWSIVENEGNLVTKMEKDIVVKNNSNSIVVTVKMVDRAGNTSEDNIVFSIDKTTPVIEVVYDNNEPDEEYNDIYKADREATVTVTERNFRAENIIFAILNTDNDIPVIDLAKPDAWTVTPNDEDPDKTVHVAKIKYTSDGDYTFDIAYSDNAGNSADDFEQHKFTIDKTIPVVTVTYDNNNALNGNYYNADRVASITVKEHNFDASRVKILGVATDNNSPSSFPSLSAWVDNGDDTYTATITYNTDSKYTFDIEYEDKAGNSIEDYVPVTFYIDKTAPTLEISGVADRTANNGNVEPQISYSDTNFNKNVVTITLTGINNGKVDYNASFADVENGQTYTYSNFMQVPKVDDIYTLTAKVTDMAGNTTEKSITFSVNRFGSVYSLAGIMNIISKYLYNEEDIEFTETNVDSLDRESIRIKLTKNGTPTDLIEGTDYTIEVTGGNGSWSIYKYIIKKALFADDGKYSISIYSKDAAGNVNENIDETKEAEISFGIDKTKPVIVPIDFESGMQYAVEVKTASVEIKDNLVLEDVKIYLNGEEVEYNVDGENYSFDISMSNNKQNVKIVAVDAAGNEQTVEVADFLINTNVFVRWYNNTPLFIGSIAGVVMLALCITVFIVFFRKKHNR